MRKEIFINEGWIFTDPDGTEQPVDVPHTWNNIDGQNGGNDYWRGTCHYRKSFPKVEDPYLYTATARLLVNGEEIDQVASTFGVRSFHVDPDKGFFLNGRSYPLHDVSRHQDWKGIGNALTKEHHDKNMELIREMGVNTIRLAHYQHDQYFYDLCNKYSITKS